MFLYKGLAPEHRRKDRSTYITILGGDVGKTWGVDNSLDLQGSPYDFCSLMQYRYGKNDREFKKTRKYANLGCSLGQSYFKHAQPSVLDIQEINSKYQCKGFFYEQLGACSDYFQ